MMEFPPKRLSKGRFRVIYFAAQADLAEARRQRHREWIATLEGRMVYLQRVHDHFQGRRDMADEPAIVEAA